MDFTEAEIDKFTQFIDVMFADASVRTKNALKGELNYHGVKFVGQLLAYTDNDFLRVPNLGRACLREIREVLEQNDCVPGYLSDFKQQLVDDFKKSFTSVSGREFSPSTPDSLEAIQFASYLDELPSREPKNYDFAQSMKKASQPYAMANWLAERLPQGSFENLSIEFLIAVIADPAVEKRVEEVLVQAVQEKLGREGGPS